MSVRGAGTSSGRVRRSLVAAGAWPLLLAAIAAGCGKEQQQVTVSVHAPNAQGEVVPIPGAELTLLPFDIDSLYAALEEKNQAGPPPATDSVDAYFTAFTAADSEAAAAESLFATRTRTLEGLTDRTTQEYRQAFTAYQEAERQVQATAARRDTLEDRYAATRQAYNRARTTWESSAWDNFGPIKDRLYEKALAPRDSAGGELGWQHRTGEDGTFRIHVTPGRWWLAGRVSVPGTQNRVYRWNVPVVVDGEPVTVELTAETAKVLPTY